MFGLGLWEIAIVVVPLCALWGAYALGKSRGRLEGELKERRRRDGGG